MLQNCTHQYSNKYYNNNVNKVQVQQKSVLDAGRCRGPERELRTFAGIRLALDFRRRGDATEIEWVVPNSKLMIQPRLCCNSVRCGDAWQKRKRWSDARKGFSNYLFASKRGRLKSGSVSFFIKRIERARWMTRRISIFPLGDEHVGTAKVVFGESRRLREGRVYRPRVVSGVLTTNALVQVAGVFRPNRVSDNLYWIPTISFLRRSNA